MPRNDAQNNKPYYSSTTYPPSPPVQLPTPLPDESLAVIHSALHSALYPAGMEDLNVVSPLIDFDTPTPPQPTASLPVEASPRLGSDQDVASSRSPPFREAPLPQDSPPPLPIRPRVPRWALDADQEHQRMIEGKVNERTSVGHSRTPTFSSPGSRTASTPVSPIFAASSVTASTIENLSRTIRGYVPSITTPTPTSASSLSNSRGIGLLASSSPPSGQNHSWAASQQEFERDYDRHNEENDDYDVNIYPVLDQPRSVYSLKVEVPASGRQLTGTMGSSGLAQAMQRNLDEDSKPTRDQIESVIWARWDVLHDRQWLIVGYLCGLQVWDCTNLSSVDEVLNLNLDSAEWRTLLESEDPRTSLRLVHAAVLPFSSTRSVHYGAVDPFMAQRPLLGILLESTTEGALDTTFFLYCPRYKHQVMKRLGLAGAPSTFVSNEDFTVISTINPTILYVLSSTTFQILHKISSTSLELFIPQVSSTSQGNAHSSSSGPDMSNRPSSPKSLAPSPVFALSHRLLAYSSSPSTILTTSQESVKNKETRRYTSSNAPSPSGPESSTSSSPFGFRPPSLGEITAMARVDVGHAALKVGETVFSGMKHFGGMALEAAKNRVVSGQSFGGNRRPSTGGGRDSSGGGRFVSRSAPDHLSFHDETEQKPRPLSSTSIGDPHPIKVAPSMKSSRGRGHYVTVIDLALLRNQQKVTKIDEILVSASQPAAKLEFSTDGTSLGVGLRDGHSVKVFKLKPSPGVVAFSIKNSMKNKAEEESEAEYQRSSATQVYDLHRGRTSAVIESIVWAKDGRYVGISTMNRTVHIYAVNPYGGKPDIRSHLEGRIRNVEGMDHSTTTLTPIARLRGSKTGRPESHAALALTFISDAELLVAPHLLPLSSPNRRTRSPPLSPASGKPGPNYQHILLFDPADGMLSLHRLALEKSPSRDPIIGGVAASIQAFGVTSISFPGTGNLGRLSTSPSAKPVTLAKTPEPLVELGAKITQVATYNLKRGRDWDEVTKPLELARSERRNSPGGDWLAEAELSTFSTSQQVIPRSIYLSHQFSFHTLGEDYHALIRSYQLHVSGNKIDVRKEVEVRTSAWNITTFAEGFSSALDGQREPSSFDEPISSAISESLDNSNIPRILPMYPNGLPGANVKSLRNSIPIRAISGLGDGVGESLGRIRNRVRPPRGATRSDVSSHSSVPLEFDEDEEFLDRHGDGDSIKSPPSNILSHTQKLLDADVVGTVDEELFDGWDVEDKLAIDEVEQFQEIAVAGLLVDEEEHRQPDKRTKTRR